jgi:hypothetical protein
VYARSQRRRTPSGSKGKRPESRAVGGFKATILKWKEKGGETPMKHVKVLSNSMPAPAAETAWVHLWNIFGKGPGSVLNPIQAFWLNAQVDHWLQK